MGKSVVALQKALENTTGTGSVVKPPMAERKLAYEQPGRAGKVQIAGWFETDYKKHLRMIQVNEDRSLQSLLAEALNLLFERHKIPTIVDEQ